MPFEVITNDDPKSAEGMLPVTVLVRKDISVQLDKTEYRALAWLLDNRDVYTDCDEPEVVLNRRSLTAQLYFTSDPEGHYSEAPWLIELADLATKHASELQLPMESEKAALLRSEGMVRVSTLLHEVYRLVVK